MYTKCIDHKVHSGNSCTIQKVYKNVYFLYTLKFQLYTTKCILHKCHKVYNVMYTSMFEFVYILCDTFFLHQTNSVWRQNLSSSSGHLHFKTLSAEQYPEFKVCYKAYKIKSSFLNAKG